MPTAQHKALQACCHPRTASSSCRHAASLARACSPFSFCLAAIMLLENLLLWRHRVFQHGGFLIPLQSKVVFALFLQRERENVFGQHTPSRLSLFRQPRHCTGATGTPALFPAPPVALCANSCLGAAGTGTLHPSQERSWLSVPFSAQTHLFEDNVNVAGNQLGDLLSLCRLH